MDLIERYVQEVGRHLPRKQRTDVEAELRSLLQDMVEDRAQTKVEKADEAIIVEVLKEFGHPKKVAASYQPQAQYLVGPQLFPYFKMAVTTATAVLGIIMLAGVTLSVRNSDAFLRDWISVIIRAIPDFIGVAISTFAIIVVIFAVLERTLPEDTFDEKEEETWQPQDLPAVGKGKDVVRGGLVQGVAFSVIFLVLLNVFPEWAGIIYGNDELVIAVPLLSANFYANLLPWVNLWLLVSIAVDVYKLRLGRQTRRVMALDLGVTLLTAVIIVILMTNEPIFGVNQELLALHGNEVAEVPGRLSVLADTFNTLLSVGLPVLFAVQIILAGKKGYELWQMPDDDVPSELAGKMG